MIWFWLILAALMLAAELATTALVSIWFVAGALAAAGVACLHLPVWMQAAAFGVVSALLFVFCREWLLRHFTSRKLPGNTDRLLQSIGVVTVPVMPAAAGRVQVAGQDWKAVSADEEEIPAGTRVRILKIEGVRLYVIPAPDHQLLRAEPGSEQVEKPEQNCLKQQS